VIAEGVETEDQLRYLVDRRCDLLQGYYLSRPLYPDDVPAMLQQDFMEYMSPVEEAEEVS
jgi:EAL domain-containing protein (putative c-di-GMP-specific phosphodiesterase class I)